MPRARAAQRVAAQNVAPLLSALLSPARAEASRKNGAKSRGPKTREGKARSAQNALKHGLRAERYVVLGDEDLDEFDALAAALTAELAPQGALQAILARRIVAATWRLERAERMEGELLAQNIRGTTSFGLAMIRDCNGARAFDTLLRYRGGTLAELWRALRTLKALQAEARADEEAAAARQKAAAGERQAAMPIEPKARSIGGQSARAPGPAAPVPAAVSAEPARAHGAAPVAALAAAPARLAPQRIEPKCLTKPGESAPPTAREIVRGLAALLATAPIPPGRRSSP
jgi:hypothetical protein